MDGHACLRLAGSLDSLVYMVSPHPLATILRQQCRVEVDNATRIGVNQEIGHQRQEACQYDKLDAVLTQQRQHHLSVIQFGFRDDSRLHAQIPGTHQRIGVRFVTHHKGTVH